MRYLTLGEVVELHRRLLQATGGTPAIRDLAALESAIAQPKAALAGVDLYPTLAEKAATLGFSLLVITRKCGILDAEREIGFLRLRSTTT
jgi:death-on-curing protein